MSTTFVTTRTGGGKRIYRRSHRSRLAAVADAERARADGRDATVTRRDLYEEIVDPRTTPPFPEEGQRRAG